MTPQPRPLWFWPTPGPPSDACFSPQQEVIFDCLKRHAGRTVSYDALVALLYDHRADGGPDDPRSVLACQICHLRRLLRPSGETIRTIWGRGYQLTDADD